MKKVAVIVGSLRKNSNSQKIADNIKTYFSKEVEVVQVPIKDLPFYNPDIDTDQAPQAYKDFRQQMKGVDGVVFITPEYNRGLPAVLKNALDVGSRPRGENVFADKLALVISFSVSNLSGFAANHQLRQSLVVLGMPVIQQPEVYLANIESLFDDKGSFVPSTQDFMKSVIQTYLSKL